MPAIPEPAKPGRDELQRRNALALSLLNQRRPSVRVCELAKLALLGASVADLMEVERNNSTEGLSA